MESSKSLDLLLAAQVREIAIGLVKRKMKSMPQEEYDAFLTEHRVLEHVPEALRRLQDVATAVALAVGQAEEAAKSGPQ